MSLTILNVAYPLAPVSPDAVGGAEQILCHIDAALVGAGHRSLVIAREDSQVAGTLVPVPAETEALEGARERAWQRHRRAIAETLRRWPVDLVHLHGLDFAAYLPEPGVPVLATLHLPAGWYEPDALAPARPDTWLHGVSHSQHATLPPGSWFLPPIENGVPVAALGAARHARRGYALVLARVCPEKGIHLALEAARQADVPLLVAGEVFAYEAHQRYFAEEVAPRLDGRRRFIGPVSFARKRRLLHGARCLLVPSTAPETSSLVAREALACGTPVIAFPVGALPETVEHGRTGYLVGSVEDMAAAIQAVDGLDRGLCRAVAEERFSLERMTRRYLERYRDLVRGRLPAGRAPALTGAA